MEIDSWNLESVSSRSPSGFPAPHWILKIVQHNFDRRQTFVIISVEKVKWWIISTVYTYLPCQTLILFFKRILRCDFSLRRNTVLKFRLSIDREKTKMQKYRKYVGKYLWKNSTSATLVATTEKKKKKECKFSEHFEIQPSSDFVHQTIELAWFICTCYSKIHPRISEKFFLASFRVNDPLWRWFLFESKNKRDKGGGRGKGKNWHPLCTHPNSPSGKLILNSKVRAVGLPPLMRSIPFILR